MNNKNQYRQSGKLRDKNLESNKWDHDGYDEIYTGNHSHKYKYQ